MPIFYFDVTGDGFLTEDVEGIELDNTTAAEAEALQLLPDLMHCIRPPNQEGLKALVRDEGGRPIFEAALCLTGRRLT